MAPQQPSAMVPLWYYFALETNDSAVQVLGDDNLPGIARELVKIVKASVTMD